MGSCGAKLQSESTKYTKIQQDEILDELFKQHQNEQKDTIIKDKLYEWTELKDCVCPIIPKYPSEIWHKFITINNNEFITIEVEKEYNSTYLRSIRLILKSIYKYNSTQNHYSKLINKADDDITPQIEYLLSEGWCTLSYVVCNVQKQCIYFISNNGCHKMLTLDIINNTFKLNKFQIKYKLDSDNIYPVIVDGKLHIFYQSKKSDEDVHGHYIDGKFKCLRWRTYHLVWNDDLEQTEKISEYDHEHKLCQKNLSFVIYNKWHGCVLLFGDDKIYSYSFKTHQISDLHITTPIKFQKCSFLQTNDSKYILIFGG
eukprot:432761_1